MSEVENKKNRTLETIRVFNAPIEIIWKCWNGLLINLIRF